MPEASPKARQARRRTGLPKPIPKLPATPPSSRRRMRRTRISRTSISGRTLPRSASEPVLLLLPWSIDDDSRRSLCLSDPLNFSSAPQLPLLPPTTPSRTTSFSEEAKVVVTVTVEGSPGPVRAMVKLGATVEEAIGVVVDRYAREGRSPRLDWDGEGAAAAGLFQLHHSHFSLQSLNKSEKIGEVGGRSFYLRRSSGNDVVRSEGRNAVGGSEIELVNGGHNTAPAHIFSFIAQRLRKFKRRTGRIWRILTCITCWL
ncbi:uncharacterized protein M6B38_398410 [Iris pallida]|uniref:DUF7054 domain-containing protein n=1 Tax=Iris pallida TaxID=29817 RepID=A0AAX6FV81_IRIPA|nr:uncharacterized protein M6B38_398410 [Iris pallida]